jgi:hypothetical protein
MNLNKKTLSATVVLVAALIVVGTLIAHTVLAFTNLSSQVVVGASNPVIPSVVVNGASPISLNTNSTTSVNVTATITDVNGCGELTPGTTTVLLYRSGSGVTSSTCMGSQDPRYCYSATSFTTSTCSAGTETATTTFALQYFAQPTDTSSSFSGQKWVATVKFTTPDNTTGTMDATGVTLNTLTAINVTTSSINYGPITANSDTGSANQTTTVANVGNSSTSLQVYALTTLTSGSSNTIATSSQTYYTSPFTYQGSSVPLTGAAVTVSGFMLTAPVSLTNVTGSIYWGLGVPNGTPTGTYSGTNVFTSSWHA